MSEYLRSALNNFNFNWTRDNDDPNGDTNDEFIGQFIELNGRKLKVEKIIAKGGFGYVFAVKDNQTQKKYALKRLISSGAESKKEIKNEIDILVRLQGIPHIMKFITWGTISSNTFLLLTEYCGGGSLYDIPIPMKNITQMNRILYQTSKALKKMHEIGITHRDIKMDNILFDNEGFVKLCDFGSAMSEMYYPDHNWTAIQRSLLEDEMNRHTTPMYRPPEIIDTYQNFPINTAMDIWALGCFLYVIKFGRHPFGDCSKLRIINCNYSIPYKCLENDIHAQIIKSSLKADPRQRISISEIINLLEMNYVDLNLPCIQPRQNTPITTQPINTNSPLHQLPSHGPGSAQPTFGLSGFFRYLKDSKVVQTVQQSIARQDLDLTFLTSRLAVMSYPAEGLESTFKNHIEDVKSFFESRKQEYAVVNISGRAYESSRFGKVKVFHGGSIWKDTSRPPALFNILTLCESIKKWLNDHTNGIIVIHCMDGKINSALLATSLMIWIRLFDDWRDSINVFAVKRVNVPFTNSHQRYLEYISRIRMMSKNLKYSYPVTINSVFLNGIPLFNKNKDGCRPYIEIFDGNDIRLASTCTDYDGIRPYDRLSSPRIVWKDLNAHCMSDEDITLIISHARTRVLQGKIVPIRICSITFNFSFEKGPFLIRQLDGIDDLSKFPREFSITIESEFGSTKQSNRLNFDIINNPLCLFKNEHELEDFKEVFNCCSTEDISDEKLFNDKTFKEASNKKSKPARPPPPALQTEKAEMHSPTKNIENDLFNEAKVIDGFDWQDEIKDPMIEENTKKTKITDDLLNLSVKDEFDNGFLNHDLAEDKNLLIDTEEKTENNFDVLNDIFTNNISSINQSTSQCDLLSNEPIQPTSTLHRNTSTPNLTKLDPLTELDSFVFSTNPPNGKATLTPQNTCKVPFFSTFQSTNQNHTQNHYQNKPDYSRAHFEELPIQANNAPKVSGNEFEDLLSGFPKRTVNESTNKSLASMKKQDLIREGADPIKLKVDEWKENKRRNIIALLGSLQDIVWEDCNWQPIGIHQLMTPSDVKKMYRKACLAVHPDKLIDTEHEELAKLIFIELNDAWNEFEKQQQLKS